MTVSGWRSVSVGLTALAVLASGCSSSGGSAPHTSKPVDPLDSRVCVELQRFVDVVNRKDARGQEFYIGAVGSAARKALDSTLRHEGLAFTTNVQTNQRTAQAAAKNLVQECKRLGIPIKHVNF